MGIDADNPQIAAVCSALGLQCKIYNLDSTEGDQANSFELSPLTELSIDASEIPRVFLLYRPGHYDLLLKK